MKKIFTALLILSTCINLYGCNFSKEKYIPQENINFNYNNVSAEAEFWLTNEYACFLEHNLTQSYYLYSENGRKRIMSNSGYVSGKVQIYGNTIYTMEETNFVNEEKSYYLLKSYDIQTKKVTKIAKFKNCTNYLVLGDAVYILEQADGLILKEFSSATLNTISENVFSFGVINGKLVYVKDEGTCISIYQLENAPVKIGEITSGYNKLKNYFAKACFTSEYVIFAYSDYSKSSGIVKYNLTTGEINETQINGLIENFVSYDKYSYFTMPKILFDEEKNAVYKMSNDTSEWNKIGDFNGGSSIFVGSDDGAYVLEYNSSDIVYYSQDGESKTVYGENL